MNRIQELKKTVIEGIIVLALVFSFCNFFNLQASAANFEGELCGGANLSLKSGSCGKEKDNAGKLDKLIGNIINILSVIVGVVAVVMIIYGGFKLITSSGDSGRLTSARQTILYALAGLVIVALAQVIARFILTNI